MTNFRYGFLFLALLIACNETPVILGATGAEVEKRVTTAIDGSTQIDMLWVIDNSGSMCQEQDVLARNFDLFVDEIEKTNLDFHIGVTTTDMEIQYSVDPVANPGHLQAIPQPIPSNVDPTCINGLDDSGNLIQGDYDPIFKSIERANACLKDSTEGFVPSAADIECAISGTPANCQIAGRCGEDGTKCQKKHLYPTMDQYRIIPKVLKAADYKTGNTLDVEKLKEDFSCMSFVGTLGWGVEKGLAAALEATKPELTGGPVDDEAADVFNAAAVNHGLLRKNSRFALVFVTDENDCSDDGSLSIQGACGVATCEYANIEGKDEGLVKVDNIKANLLENLSVSKNRPDLDESEILVASIHGRPKRFTEAQVPEQCESGTPNGVLPVCANLRGRAYSGDRYQRFLQTFNEGNYFPAAEDTTQGWLCAGDFAPALGAIGTFVSNVGTGCISDPIFPCDEETQCPAFRYSEAPGTCIDRPGSEEGERYCDSGIQIRAELISPTPENFAALESAGYCESGSVADSEYPHGCVVSPEKYEFISCSGGLLGLRLAWNDEKEAKIALGGTLVEIRYNSLSSNSP